MIISMVKIFGTVCSLFQNEVISEFGISNFLGYLLF